MIKSNVMRPLARANAFVAAAVLASTAILPAVLLSGSASGAQLENRFIDMSSALSSSPSTAGSGRDGGDTAGQSVTYTVGFDIPVTGNIGAVAVEFCNNSPILLDTCTAPTGFDVDTGSSNPTNQVGISGFTKDALSAANLYVISGTAASVTSNTTNTTTVDGRTVFASDLKFDITGITNPTTLGTFYARITTYSAAGNLPTTWDSTATGATGIGTIVDDGGIALSVANELRVTARVQEVLQFCIGTETSSAAALAGVTPDSDEDCGDISGTSLSLGVVDSNSVQNTNDGDINNDGLVMIRTNALNGAAVFYKAEQDTSSGKLKQVGATCVGTNLDDPCFNSAGATASAIAAGTEEFGMTLYAMDSVSGGATTALDCEADYDGGTQACTGTSTPDAFAWTDTGSFDTLASSTGPIDDEKAKINFAATAAPTTPTGLYVVTANFVATSTF